jgi:hypothetical protein
MALAHEKSETLRILIIEGEDDEDDESKNADEDDLYKDDTEEQSKGKKEKKTKKKKKKVRSDPLFEMLCMSNDYYCAFTNNCTMPCWADSTTTLLLGTCQ